MRGEIIYRYLVPESERSELASEPNEYIISEVPEADAGIIVYARFGKDIFCNPHNCRLLIKHLFSQIPKATEEKGEPYEY